MFKMILDVTSTEKKEELSSKENDFKEWIFNTLEQLARNNYSYVKFYSYRTAEVSSEDVLFEADRTSLLPLEYTLAIKARVHPGNHTVYEVYNGCRTFYVWCHDELFTIGTTILTR